MALTRKYDLDHMFISLLLLFWHWPGTFIFKTGVKKNKPRRKVIGLNNTINYATSSGLKMGMENNIVWSEIGSGFWEPCGTPPTKILGSATPPPPSLPPPTGGMPVIPISNDCRILSVSKSFIWRLVSLTQLLWIYLIFTREAACSMPRFETEAKFGKGH